LSLLCHLTSPQQAPGLDFKLELLKLVTSLLPRMQRSPRRVVDIAEQMGPVLERQLQSRQETSLEEYASFYHAAREFVTALETLGADLGPRFCLGWGVRGCFCSVLCAMQWHFPSMSLGSPRC